MNQLSHSVTRLENAIVTLSGPALATSGIIAGVDILTNNLIARYAPGAGAIAGLVWAICLMLTLDFQVLMLGVRARRIYASSKKSGWQKFGELALCVAIAAALGYVSLQMGSIFARMLGTNLTIVQAQADLGINPIALIYERSALVLLLIFLSGWLREHDAATVEASTSAPVAPAPTAIPAPVAPDWREMLQEFAKMQQVTIERTLETVMERVTITPVEQADTPLQIEAPGDAQNGLANLESICQQDETTQSIYPGRFASKEQVIADILRRNPNATLEEVVQRAQAQCNPRTAEKWYRRLKKPNNEQETKQ